MSRVGRHSREVAMPLAIAILGTVEILGWRPPGTVIALVMMWVTCALLVLRRRFPLLVGTIAGFALIPLPYFGPELDDLSTPILVIGLATYSLARYVADLRGLIPVVVQVVALMGDMVLTREAANVTDIVFVTVLIAPWYIFGRVMRLLADRNRVLAEHAALLTLQQESAQREAVAAERARMAREVHDVIAHSVSVMTVQAAAAEELVRSRPDAAIEALQEVQSAGRGALAETGRLLRLLRDNDDELGLAPERGIADLAALVAEFQRGGLQVDLDIDGDLGNLPRGIAVSAYRVIREILTNGLRYAAGRRLALRVTLGEGALEVSTENRTTDGDGAPTGGLGLIGVAERVAIHDGHFAYAREGDRFHLTASLPLAAAA